MNFSAKPFVLVCLFVALCAPGFAVPAFAQSTSLPESPAAESGPCPAPLTLVSSNDTDYIVSFDATKPATASFAVRLYSASNDYTATLKSVAVTVPYMRADGAQRFRSAAIDLYAANGAKVAAATVDATLADGTVCPTNHVFVPSAAALHYRVHYKSDDDLLGAFASEVGDGSNAIQLTAEPPTSFPCANPFSIAKAKTTVTPDYPDFAKEDGAPSGTSTAMVYLDADAHVVSVAIYRPSGYMYFDNATVMSAKQSTYVPAMFACKPIAGSFSFRADFIKNYVPDKSNHR